MHGHHETSRTLHRRPHRFEVGELRVGWTRQIPPTVLLTESRDKGYVDRFNLLQRRENDDLIDRDLQRSGRSPCGHHSLWVLLASPVRTMRAPSRLLSPRSLERARQHIPRHRGSNATSTGPRCLRSVASRCPLLGARRIARRVREICVALLRSRRARCQRLARTPAAHRPRLRPRHLEHGAEREGFEPSDPVSQVNSLAVSPIRPLSHLSLGTVYRKPWVP